jgi:hypothetical protein
VKTRVPAIEVISEDVRIRLRDERPPLARTDLYGGVLKKEVFGVSPQILSLLNASSLSRLLVHFPLLHYKLNVLQHTDVRLRVSTYRNEIRIFAWLDRSDLARMSQQIGRV